MWHGLSLLKYTSNRPTLCHRKSAFSGVFGAKGSIGTLRSALLPGIAADQTCARQERDLRAFAKKAGYKVVGVWERNGFRDQG